MTLLRSVMLSFLPPDLRQNMRLEELEARASRLQRNSRRQHSATARIEQLEQQVGELLLLVQAMLQEHVRRGSLDPTEFETAMQQLDLSDGSADGRLAKAKPPVDPPRPPRRRRPS